MATPHLPARRPAVDPAWRAQRLAEARTVVANVARHSDHLVRLACQVLTTHGQSERERRDARALLFAIEARCPARHRRAQALDPEVRR